MVVLVVVGARAVVLVVVTVVAKELEKSMMKEVLEKK